MSPPYQILPAVYDRWQQSYGKDYTSLILPRLLTAIGEYGIPTGVMLDLACGTGTLALKMAQRGWRVWGVDGSEGMLQEARKKLAPRRPRITFLRQDLRTFSLPVCVHLATCLFDSLNHLLSVRDVQKAFRRVYATLLPGGYFVFDLNNELCYRTLWTQNEVIHQDDFTIALQNTYHPRKRLGESHVTLFVRRGRVFERMSETVLERLYSIDQITLLLEQAGFRSLENTDFNFTDRPEIGNIKTWWVAQKPLA